MKYDLAVVIGRFQPFHTGHAELIRHAFSISKKVLVVVGSAYQPRTFKNPFTENERAEMIFDEFHDKFYDLYVEPNIDTIYNDNDWVTRIQFLVQGKSNANSKVVLVGHTKDESSYYLNKFPQWDFIDYPTVVSLHATDIRNIYFRKDVNLEYFKNVVPESTYKFLKNFTHDNCEEFNQIIRERKFLEDHAKQYSHLKYAPTFNTADAVVFQSGHILLVERAAEPGRGLWALPGGYLNAKIDKSLLDAAMRELKEETKIDVPLKVLYGCVKGNHVFDAVNRSPRGRIVTQAFKIELPDGPLPKVKGSDDAVKAFWQPLSNIRRHMLFEDHADIIQWFK